MRKLSLLVGFLLLASLGIFAAFASAKEQSVVVAMSGLQSGTATLTANSDNTDVAVDITPGIAGVAQPAHIHSGVCPDVGGVKYPLNGVVDGKSFTTVNASLSDLLTGGLAVNVHLSATELSAYVSCGEIPMASTETPADTSGLEQLFGGGAYTAPAQGDSEQGGGATAEAPAYTPGLEELFGGGASVAEPQPQAAPEALPSAGDGSLSMIVMVTAIIGALALGAGLVLARRKA